MDTPDGFTWQPGTYRVEVRATRLVSAEPLVGAVAFELDEADVARLRQEGPGRFVSFDASDGG